MHLASLIFSILPLEINFFQSWPSGPGLETPQFSFSQDALPKSQGGRLSVGLCRQGSPLAPQCTASALSTCEVRHYEIGSEVPKPVDPGHLRPVIIKPVGRIFEISDSNPIRRKCGKCGRSLSPQKKGSEEIPRSEKVENAETKTRKMRMTGFNVTGFRWGGF